MKAIYFNLFVVALTLMFVSVQLALAEDSTNAVSSAAPQAMQALSKDRASHLLRARIEKAKNNLPQASAFSYKLVISGQNASTAATRFVEFQVTSESIGPSEWSCWESEVSHPHDFTLYSSKGNVYASYCSSEGIKIFHVNKNVNSNTAMNLFMKNGTNLGALPPLRIGLLKESVGGEPFYGVNALYWTINVDDVIETNGDMEVTFHGVELAPQFVFALKNGKWQRK